MVLVSPRVGAGIPPSLTGLGPEGMCSVKIELCTAACTNKYPRLVIGQVARGLGLFSGAAEVPNKTNEHNK